MAPGLRGGRPGGDVAVVATGDHVGELVGGLVAADRQRVAGPAEERDRAVVADRLELAGGEVVRLARRRVAVGEGVGEVDERDALAGVLLERRDRAEVPGCLRPGHVRPDPGAPVHRGVRRRRRRRGCWGGRGCWGRRGRGRRRGCWGGRGRGRRRGCRGGRGCRRGRRGGRRLLGPACRPADPLHDRGRPAQGGALARRASVDAPDVPACLLDDDDAARAAGRQVLGHGPGLGRRLRRRRQQRQGHDRQEEDLGACGDAFHHPSRRPGGGGLGVPAGRTDERSRRSAFRFPGHRVLGLEVVRDAQRWTALLTLRPPRHLTDDVAHRTNGGSWVRRTATRRRSAGF